MKYHRSIELVALLLSPARADRDITAVSAEGIYIHSEITGNFAWTAAGISLKSNVPVTVQHYSDGARFFDGQKPVLPNEAYVVVTSDCSTESTDAVPRVTFTEDGEVNVSIDGVDEDAGAAMAFLKPSYYSAVWDWFDSWCGGKGSGGFLPVTASPIDMASEGGIFNSVALPEDFGEKGPIQCLIGPNGIAFCESNEFCMEEEGKCTNSNDIPQGTCTIKPDGCDQNYEPVCGCDKKIYGNECQAAAEGVSIDYPGECKETADLTDSQQTFSIDPWIIQPYADRNASVGDTVEFTWTPGIHNLYVHPTGTCDMEGRILLGDEEDGFGSHIFTADDAAAGTVTFACDVGISGNDKIAGHCAAGQIVTFNVVDGPASSSTEAPWMLRTVLVLIGTALVVS